MNTPKTPQPTMADLRQAVVLVELNISSFTGNTRTDKGAHQLAQANQADERALSAYYKALRDEDKKSVSTPVSQARSRFYEMTVPWDNSGRRACPVERLQALVDFLEARKTEMFDAARRLVERYDELTDIAHQRAGELWDARRWPSRAKLEGSFGWNLQIEPLPNTDDIRLKHVDPALVEKIERNMQGQLTERFNRATRDLARRLLEMVERCVERLSDPNATFRDSLIQNLRRACRDLPTLNLGNDRELALLFERIDGQLAGYEPQTLRDRPRERQKAAETAKGLLADLKRLNARDQAQPDPPPLVPPMSPEDVQAEAARIDAETDAEIQAAAKEAAAQARANGDERRAQAFEKAAGTYRRGVLGDLLSGIL